MAKHTPGPWFVRHPHPTAPIVSLVVDDVNRSPICHLSLGAHEARENAKLIAAAPELLEALKTALSLIENGDFSNGVTEYGIDNGEVLTRPLIKQISEAIAKAEG